MNKLVQKVQDKSKESTQIQRPSKFASTKAKQVKRKVVPSVEEPSPPKRARAKVKPGIEENKEVGLKVCFIFVFMSLKRW